MGIRAAASLALAIGAGFASGAGPLGIRVQPLYEGRRASGMVALVATVSNSGRDATGAVVVSTEGMAPVRFPVALPRGSVKRVRMLAPLNAYYGTPTVVLETDRGSVRAMLPPSEIAYGEDHPGALLIGGASGELNFLEESTGLFVQAESAPDRPIAYASMRFVVLGEGAERMSDGVVDALQAWAETGGTIVVVGGASNPLLFDRRWTPFLPLEAEGSRQARIPRSVEKLWGRPMPDAPIAVAFGRVAPGARVAVQGPVPLVMDRPLGSGRVLMFAFNPFEGPLRTWPGRKKMFEQHLPAMGSTGMMGLQSQPSYFGGTRIPSSPGVIRNEPDPFTVELPATGTVLMLLAGYVVLVVPINFLLLRKLKRGEWAWVTSPLLSLGFAAVFFSFAADLYKTPLGRAVTGTLYLDSRLDHGYLVGNAQLFIPRGGTYDLRFDAVDWVAPVGFDLYGSGYGGRTESRIDLGLVDNGNLHARRAAFPNLAFHQFGFAQRLETAGWLAVRGSVKNGKVRLELTNGSPYSMAPTIGKGDANALPVGILAPGASGAVQLAGSRVPPHVFVFGSLEGLEAGPRLGKDYSSPTSMRFEAVVQVVNE
ncbi:MAG: hypothetical protein H6534_03575 [Chthonomonadaceae bacterium]|nr:hypothetical protein [Chthonomonadaceae bacterium]